MHPNAMMDLAIASANDMMMGLVLEIVLSLMMAHVLANVLIADLVMMMGLALANAMDMMMNPMLTIVADMMMMTDLVMEIANGMKMDQVSANICVLTVD